MVLFIAAGGALGAVARYVLGGQIGAWLGGGLPWGTFIVNVLGAFAIGVLVELWAVVWSPAEEMRAFLTVGVLGGFTTFSAFSMEVVWLMERGRLDLATTYAMASVVLSVGALFVGLRLTRLIVA